MMSCKEATRLMSEEQDRNLSARERITLRFHTIMCIGCTNYRKHMAFLRRAAQRFRDGFPSSE
ncbi:MAG TPA: zf-HC2 domain-containing protein [Rhodocyclaceae bacterium]|nr:zf-HC2 domain-containing protein [Rhodocyclaceae bacterium]